MSQQPRMTKAASGKEQLTTEHAATASGCRVLSMAVMEAAPACSGHLGARPSAPGDGAAVPRFSKDSGIGDLVPRV